MTMHKNVTKTQTRWVRYSDAQTTRERLSRSLRGWWKIAHPVKAWHLYRARWAAREAIRKARNQLFLKESLADPVLEGFKLSDEQKRAVVIDEDCNLVVAAAGSGKTRVIMAKAGWLIRKGHRCPSELLLLAFARDARKEMEDRAHDFLGQEAVQWITFSTFHRLGMTIIGDVEGRRPAISRVAEDKKALQDLLKDIVADLLAEKEISDNIVKWFQSEFAPYRSTHEFRSWGAYWDYIRQHGVRSLKGEKVKSFEECEIANFLYLNGVSYEYEPNYEHETATPERRQYQPDFYLTDAGIYIEHCALSASGDTPPFIDRDEYLQSMDWKRRLHAEHGTTLIETFSHEHAEGNLTDNLARTLRTHGVTFSPIPPEEIFSVLERQGRVDPFINLLATFIAHYKGAQLTFSEVSKMAQQTGTRGDRLRAKDFLRVFKPVFEQYQARLSQSGQFDFHDMIGKATEYVESGRWRVPFKYILVDEFQDISRGRARLLKALLDQSPGSQLFAVGDDWQSIYRFTGSDIAIMRNFSDQFGYAECVNLETTFRCNSHIATVATDFILRNHAQIPKNVQSKWPAPGPSVHIGLTGSAPSLLKEALDRIVEDVARNNVNKPTVLLLGRFKRKEPKNMADLKRQYPGIRLCWKSVHGSKGLEADYVVVVSLYSGMYGFPTEITDDPLLDLVLSAPEQHPNAEERRLFYVAMTRAKRQVYLLAEGGPPSPFVAELMDGTYDVDVFGRSVESEVPCRKCSSGRMKRRKHPSHGTTFYGCSNWPYCEHTQWPCPACGEGLLVKTEDAFLCRQCGEAVEGCPLCDGWLVPRRSKHGPFLGCSNYSACLYTRDIRKH